MALLKELLRKYNNIISKKLSSEDIEDLNNGLKSVIKSEISSSNDAAEYIGLVAKSRQAISDFDKSRGANYHDLLTNMLIVGADGVYSDTLRFIFELIQNVDDCDYQDLNNCSLDIRFDFNEDEIILQYNEDGFTPFNVFAITGIAEAAKNLDNGKTEIGEKGIGFKSVFGVANKVWIQSGWFSFELEKSDFTIPKVPKDKNCQYTKGTIITIYVEPGKAKSIYDDIRNRYCSENAIFSQNPILFLNKLTSLSFYFDKSFKHMEFKIDRCKNNRKCLNNSDIIVEDNVSVSVDLRDSNIKKSILCTRYTYPICFSKEACKARYGSKTRVGEPDGKRMHLRVLLPNLEYLSKVGKGGLYSFLPTQIKLTVPIVCDVPFKLDVSREFVDPQGDNLWFKEATKFLSELMDYAYLDWSHIIKENIIHYLPGKTSNLFSKNNGKERCLINDSFSGIHYLMLPIFRSMDGTYHRASEVFTFEDLPNPEIAYRLLGKTENLFLAASTTNVDLKARFNIQTESKTDILDKLFNRALDNLENADEILTYLDSNNYPYSDNKHIIKKHLPIQITNKAVSIIFKHREFCYALKNELCSGIKSSNFIDISLINTPYRTIKDILNREGFEYEDTPNKVKKYLDECNNKCFCLDIDSDKFFPCVNGIILSNSAPYQSFVSFCKEIDPHDPFSARMEFRIASIKLDKYVDDSTISDADYMHQLKNVRLGTKDALGPEGYRNYINLILNAGTHSHRFLHELLQNADDCIYPPETKPSFSFTKSSHNSVIIEYNEAGFNRLDIRSITAIGESTKTKLLDHETIGEKGAGFKTIFTVASNVKIHSGKYHFSLSADAPTIPRIIENVPDIHGTKMEITLKKQDLDLGYASRDILELCLCLRRLKYIQFKTPKFNHCITIEDINENGIDKRRILIDNQAYNFRRFTHQFTITDSNAQEESHSNRQKTPNQQISLFVPESSSQSDYPLYCGLPLNHRIRIPLVIDAPFMLTTSREEIITANSAWNRIIRAEMYNALVELIDNVKSTDGISVLRFCRFTRCSNQQVYLNEISDNNFINNYDYSSRLKNIDILPIFASNKFVKPNQGLRYPAPIITMARLLKNQNINLVLDNPILIRDEYKQTLNALGVKEIPFVHVHQILSKYVHHCMDNAKFRSELFDYLKNESDNSDCFISLIHSLPIIPILGDSQNRYISLSSKDKEIYITRNHEVSTSDYYILDEKKLAKHECEKLLNVNISEMTTDLKYSLYNSKLKSLLSSNRSSKDIYYALLNEFSANHFNPQSYDILIANIYRVPLKNQLNQITYSPLFICNQDIGYFRTDIIKSITVASECKELAKRLNIKELNQIHYSDIQDRVETKLTIDAWEEICDDYFIYKDDILRGLKRDNLLPNTISPDDENYRSIMDFSEVCEYMGYCTPPDSAYSIEQTNYSDQFPEDRIKNLEKLKTHISSILCNPIEITNRTEQRIVQVGYLHGKYFYLNTDIMDARIGALHKYAPNSVGACNACFCQMCRQLRNNQDIIVNCILSEPKYFFPELRIALCFECSRYFEQIRYDSSRMTQFNRSILNHSISESEGIAVIHIDASHSITFTAVHLAEIQLILQGLTQRGLDLKRNRGLT